MTSKQINQIVRARYPDELIEEVPIFDHYIRETGTAYCNACNGRSGAIFEKLGRQFYHIRDVDNLVEISRDSEMLPDQASSADSLPTGRFLAPTDADQAPYDPSSTVDAREATVRAIKARRGQQGFRKALLEAYGGRCAITGCDVLDVLEAAHITPYLGPKTNHVTNGLLLRADLHTLFDCGLLAVDPATLKVVVAPILRQSDYGALHGRPLSSPQDPASTPSGLAFLQHLTESGIGTGA